MVFTRPGLSCFQPRILPHLPAKAHSLLEAGGSERLWIGGFEMEASLVVDFEFELRRQRQGQDSGVTGVWVCGGLVARSLHADLDGQGRMRRMRFLGIISEISTLVDFGRRPEALEPGRNIG